MTATNPRGAMFHGGAQYVRGQEGVKNRGPNGFRARAERVKAPSAAPARGRY
jgi:hypothetical protein